MRNNILFFSAFLIGLIIQSSSSNANKGRYLLALGEGLPMTMKAATRGRVRLTPGFIPPHLPTQSEYLVKMPHKVQFLDREGTLFTSDEHRTRMADMLPPEVTVESDHSIRVDLKKKPKTHES